MPYIKQERRAVIDNYLAVLKKSQTWGDIALRRDSTPQDCGELNYAFTMLCLTHNEIKFSSLDGTLRRVAFDYLHDKPLRYQRINDVAGAVHCAWLEIERRKPATGRFLSATLKAVMSKPYSEVAVDYEKQKIVENGDIAEYGDLDQ